jgi:divalent anion:Na+ symporter, DASS family
LIDIKQAQNAYYFIFLIFGLSFAKNTGNSACCKPFLFHTLSFVFYFTASDAKNHKKIYRFRDMTTQTITSDNKHIKWNGVKPKPFLAILIFATLIWMTPAPEGINDQTWHLFVIFLSTIIGVVLKPLPVGAVAIIAMAACVLTKTLTLKESLVTFGSPVAWLIVFAFFFAKGFIKTGLGTRIAYMFISLLGRSSLGLAYGFVFTEFLLALVIPSNTARGAGVLFPILKSLSNEYGSSPEDGTQRKIGAFLIKVVFQVNIMTSAMFLTALVGNPLIAELAGGSGITITWGSWALAAFVPGLISILVFPLILYWIYPPEMKSTPEAPKMAKEKMRQLGGATLEEMIMLGTFMLVLFLWIFGAQLGITAPEAALIGLAILLISGCVTWNDLVSEKDAWTTLVWFAAFLMMANYLTQFGMFNWLGDRMSYVVSDLSWVWAFVIMALVYYYSHYLFASVTAHIASMYSAFLIVMLAAGTPPMLAAMMLAVLSSLSACLTHYSTGTAPVFFGAGYIEIKDWWRLGAMTSVFNIVIWFTLGIGWWKLLGLW